MVQHRVKSECDYSDYVFEEGDSEESRKERILKITRRVCTLPYSNENRDRNYNLTEKFMSLPKSN